MKPETVICIFDRDLAEQLATFALSLGIAQVMSTTTAVRLRYDASVLEGYQASPYRSVRFGDWTTMRASRDNSLLAFANTIGPAEGLAEHVPESRVRHAVVAEWVQAIGRSVGLATTLRLALDSWGVRSLSAGVNARFALDDRWQLSLGYRGFLQGAARFFQDKYVNDPTMYEYYTSDKELGDERGHIGSLEVRYVLPSWPSPGRALQLDARLDALHYTYPGFVLLEQRSSVLAEVGLRIDF